MLLPLFYFLNYVSMKHIITRMPKKTLDPHLSPITDTHVGLLQKVGAVGTSAKWCSPDAASKKLQPNLFGNSSLKLLNEKRMTGEKFLLHGEDLYIDDIPSELEDRYYLSTPGR